MFAKLRLRFIAIASLAILIVLFTVVGVLNSARFIQTRNGITKVLRVLSDNDGTFPKLSKASQQLGDNISTDTIFQYRYFNAVLDADGQLKSIDSSNIADLTDEQIEDYALDIADSESDRGEFSYSFQTYSYMVTKKSNNDSLIVALDVTNDYRDDQALVFLSLWLSAASFGFFLIILTIFSGKVIEPFVANYEKQRRFITNAGHELKTPLAIISANNELVEMMNGESEWTKSTSDQVSRLTGLINGLVTMARLEEQPEIVLEDLDFSAIAEDAAGDFKGPVMRDGKKFVMSIQPDIHVKAEEKSLFELVTLLVDNANKYCDQAGTVTVKLTKSNRLAKAKLEVSNTYAAGKGVDYGKFFERFYRQDESHNSQRSGYGIGLSMAESMVKRFKGNLSVSYKGDTISFVVTI